MLKLTLKPYERVIVNGCSIRNSGRRHSIVIETHADVVRQHDLLDGDAASTPVRKAYFLIQTALIRADLREKLVPAIQKQLAALATVFGPPNVSNIFEAANEVSKMDYYKAMRALRPVLRYEEELLNHLASAERAKAAPPERGADQKEAEAALTIAAEETTS
ncbi:flagellar biosynthesis repressor FlbT [Pseudooceanicola nanhaiensis]|uniref:flagellar biosynthesis repressor FlbT n=1 Tax=Pseudooceanicola nanhaiensis TaxID=375761 RepID=UPI001CD20B74|nr:flagellar biosynthesis repressor FlbT [Pseudooceanicola nanhaiensis]MCA0922629.1 flagellar biosynthesis repressor FlbT [Pseudooceanicola nanhaiensis]